MWVISAANQWETDQQKCGRWPVFKPPTASSQLTVPQYQWKGRTTLSSSLTSTSSVSPKCWWLLWSSGGSWELSVASPAISWTRQAWSSTQQLQCSVSWQRWGQWSASVHTQPPHPLLQCRPGVVQGLFPGWQWRPLGGNKPADFLPWNTYIPHCGNLHCHGSQEGRGQICTEIILNFCRHLNLYL